MSREKTDRTCQIPFCHTKHSANGFCSTHQTNYLRFGCALAPRNNDVRRMILDVRNLLPADYFFIFSEVGLFYRCVFCNRYADTIERVPHNPACVFYVMREGELPEDRFERVKDLRTSIVEKIRKLDYEHLKGLAEEIDGIGDVQPEP